MSAKSAITDLATSLAAARTGLADVRQSAGDYPTKSHPAFDETAPVIVDLIQEACDDLDGWLLGATAEVKVAVRAAARRQIPEVAERLASAAAASERALATYVTGIGGADSITRLRDLAADQGGVCESWAWTVLELLNPLWTHLVKVRSNLDRAWLELAEHLLRDPVEVRTSTTRRPRPSTQLLTGGR